ncbi:MAG TPA: GNAT family protein [Acidobacteriaceae bacterium]|jgi:RimJ/RimL family protein N-acetyltransferase
MIASMELRPARVDDIQAIMVMERLPACGAFVGNWTDEEHRTRLASGDCGYFVAELRAGEIAGFAILRGLTSPHRSVRLQRIVVAKPGNGIGRLMLCGILDHVFREVNAHRLWLDVFESNTRAQHVYASLGFRREGVLREAILRDGEYHTQLLMSILDREYEAARHPQPASERG